MFLFRFSESSLASCWRIRKSTRRTSSKSGTIASSSCCSWSSAHLIPCWKTSWPTCWLLSATLITSCAHLSLQASATPGWNSSRTEFSFREFSPRLLRPKGGRCTRSCLWICSSTSHRSCAMPSSPSRWPCCTREHSACFWCYFTTSQNFSVIITSGSVMSSHPTASRCATWSFRPTHATCACPIRSLQTSRYVAAILPLATFTKYSFDF